MLTFHSITVVLSLLMTSWLSYKNYMYDKKRRPTYEPHEHYYGTDTRGIVIGRFFCSFIPLFNLVMCVNIIPSVFEPLCDWLEKDMVQ